MRIGKFTFLIVVFVIFSIFLFYCRDQVENIYEPQTGSISGKVTIKGESLPAVIISLSNAENQYQSLSDLSGNFQLSEVIEGKYQITAYRPGYYSDTITVRITESNPISGFNIPIDLEVPVPKPVSNGAIRIVGRELQTDFDGNGSYSSFFIKGVGYSPVPVGSWGDLIYAEQVYRRDMPLIKYMNCNAIRTWGKVNSLLLDEADLYNIKVLAGFWISTTADLFNIPFRLEVMDEFRKYVSEFKDHPAVLVWSIGNEQNYVNGDNWAWYSLVEDLSIIAYIVEGKNYHPVATPNGDRYRIGLTDYLARDVDLPYLDIWGMNLYKSDHEGFNQTFIMYSAFSSKPLWISEYGIDAYDNRINREYEIEQAKFARNRLIEMVNSQVCIGGTLMAYSDEWWKAGNPDTHDPGGYHTNAHPDGYSNEEWWGIFRVARGSTVDILTKRAVFDTLKFIFEKTN